MKFKDIQNLSNLDVTQMTTKELKEVGKVLFPVVNKRIQRLEKSGYSETPALRGLKLSQGTEKPKFSVRSAKNRNQLLSEIISAQNFAKSKTGSLSSVKSLEKGFFSRYGAEFSKEKSINSSEFWKEYRKFEEEYSNSVNKLSSDFIVSQLVNIFQSEKLKDSFLNDSDFRQAISDSAIDYVSNMGLDPEDFFTDLE